MVPLLIWSFIVLIFKSLDSKFTFQMLIEWIKDPAGTAGNYWFLPSLFCFSIIYYIIDKYFKNLWFVLLFSFVLKIRIGSYHSIFNYYNDFINLLSNFSLTKIFLNYFNISTIPSFFMWYLLGSLVFKYIIIILELKNNDQKVNILYNVIGTITIIASSFLMLKDVYNINYVQQYIKPHHSFYICYLIITTIVILISLIYLSEKFNDIKNLKNIGTNTMALLGIEPISRILLNTSFSFFNIKITYPIINTYYVLIIVTLEFILSLILINKIFIPISPIFNGKIPKIQLNTLNIKQLNVLPKKSITKNKANSKSNTNSMAIINSKKINSPKQSKKKTI